MPRVTILGNGGWGSAMALQAIRAGNQVTLWGHDSEYLAECAKTRTNPKYLPDVVMPDELLYQPDMIAALRKANIVLVAIPTTHLRETLKTAGSAELPFETTWLSLTKGVERGTLMMPSQVIFEFSGSLEVGVLSGPNIAGEVARGLPASAVIAHYSHAEYASEALCSPTFRIYSSDDPSGVELGGVIKNVIAIAAGLIDGMGLGDNAKAALIVRGIAELSRLGVAMGAKASTFSGLSGVGDMVVTCTSPVGRNRSFGERLGKGMKVEEALDTGGKVVEGYYTARSVRQLAEEHAIEMPICDAVRRILYEAAAPRDVLHQLMTREPKGE